MFWKQKKQQEDIKRGLTGGFMRLQILNIRLKLLVLRMTHHIWNTEISRLLCSARQEGIINRRQLHELVAWFDPTQRHRVYGK